MADVQCENGFTKIANAILEALAKKEMSGRSFRCLFAIFRETYGWKQKEALLSNYKLSKMTGISPQHVFSVTKELERSGVILRFPTRKGTLFSFVKDFEKWDIGIPENGNTENGNTENGITENGITENGITSITENGNMGITENGNTDTPANSDQKSDCDTPKEILKKLKESNEQTFENTSKEPCEKNPGVLGGKTSMEPEETEPESQPKTMLPLMNTGISEKKNLEMPLKTGTSLNQKSDFSKPARIPGKIKPELREVQLPESLNADPLFIKTWADWLQHLAEKKCKPTPSALEKQLKLCEALGPDDAVKTIERSIQNNWQGLFPPDGKDGKPKQTKKSVFQILQERSER